MAEDEAMFDLQGVNIMHFRAVDETRNNNVKITNTDGTNWQINTHLDFQMPTQKAVR